MEYFKMSYISFLLLLNLFFLCHSQERKYNNTVIVSAPLGKDDIFCCTKEVSKLKDDGMFMYYKSSTRLLSVLQDGKIIIVEGYKEFRQLHPRYSIVDPLQNDRICLKVKSFEMSDRDMVLECVTREYRGMGSVNYREDIKIIPFLEPQVMEFASKNVTEGEVTDISCKAKGYPSMKFIIYKIEPDKTATTIASYVVPKDYPNLEYTFKYTFNSVRVEDYGEYECRVEVLQPGQSRLPSTDHKKMKFNVRFMPRLKITESVVYGAVRKMLSFTISVRANPSAHLICSRLTNIHEPRKISILNGGPNEYSYSVTFESLSRDDEGDYTCKASNILGVDSKIVSIRVSPSQPQILSKPDTPYSDYYAIHHTFHSGSQPRNVTIFIEALKNNRYELIRTVNYLLEVKPTNSTRHEYTHHVSNLTDNLNHQLTVKVCNQDACSQKSAAVEFKTQRDNGKNRVSNKILNQPATLAFIDYQENKPGNEAGIVSICSWMMFGTVIPVLLVICA